VLRGWPKGAQTWEGQRKATDATTPSAGLADAGDRDGRDGAVAAATARVRDGLPVGGVDLDHEYGPLVEDAWVKSDEKDAETHRVRINPVWYRLSDMPAEVLLLHTAAKWHYGVDTEGHIRIGSAELGTMLSDEELAAQYRHNHRKQEPSAEQLRQFRKQVDLQGHPTIAVEFGADGEIANGRPRSRVSGEIVWNGAASRWENVKAGRYMRGSKGWTKTRKPRPAEADVRRWLDNVAAQLAAHLGVPVVIEGRRSRARPRRVWSSPGATTHGVRFASPSGDVSVDR
jgi:hypothetical protein